MNNFPVTIVDNFLDNPQYFRNYGLSLNFTTSPDYNWPGKRSKTLDQLDESLYRYINYKVLALLFDNFLNLGFKCLLQYQIIENNPHPGWIHEDFNIYTFIIYLTPETNVNCGTSLYKKNPTNLGYIRQSEEAKLEQELRLKHHKTNILTQEEELTKAKIENKFFTKTLDIKDVYNRLIIFPGNIPHSANYLSSDSNSSRLTLIGFVYDISTQQSPIYRSNNFELS